MAASLLCEIAAFLILIQIAGHEPMHPGSLGVLLVSLVAFELSSYAATRRTLHLAVIGAATGALIMTKVNAGGLVAAAVVFALVVGSKKTPRWMQITVGVLAGLLPIVLVLQNISEAWAATFALVVIMSIVGVFVVSSIDQLALNSWPLLPVASGAAAAIACSLAFPMLSGTHLSDEISGVFIRPLALPGAFTVPANVQLEWFSIVLTGAGISAAVMFSSQGRDAIRSLSAWTHAALIAVALWLLGIGTSVYTVAPYAVAKWLPALVLLPALAICGEAPAPVRLAFRALVVLATLQILVAYPVAGSQIAWGTVAMVAPCAIALAVGLDHITYWRESSVLLRGGAVALLAVILLLASNTWPPNIWKSYDASTKLGLPGTGLMRIDPNVAATLPRGHTKSAGTLRHFLRRPE